MAQLPRPPDPYRAAKAAGKAVSAIGGGIQEVAEVYRPDDERRKKRDNQQTIEVGTRLAYDSASTNGGKIAAIVVGGGLLWWLLGRK